MAMNDHLKSCEVCGELVGRSSHYHCPNCGERCSMMGHWDLKKNDYSCEWKSNALNKGMTMDEYNKRPDGEALQ